MVAELQKVEGIHDVVMARSDFAFRIRYDPARITLARVRAEFEAAIQRAESKN